MEKVMFQIKNKTLYITDKIEKNPITNINNTNIITDEDLIFDMKYLKNNIPLIANFLNVIIKNENTKNAIIKKENLIAISFELLDLMPEIENLVIEPNITIDYEMHLAILKNNTLKTINCYTIPVYLLERIDTTKSVKIETRSEVFFISNFIRVNELNNYTDVFYKKKITILSDFTDTDFEDFGMFLSINKYLKIVYFDYINMTLLKSVIKYLDKYDVKNVLVSIKGNDDNLKNFAELEKFVKKNKVVKKNKIKFRIDYTKQYQKENFLKLLNFTTIKYMLIVIIISAILGYGLNRYDIYKSSQQVEDINQDINAIIESSLPESTESTESAGDGYESPYYKNYSRAISVLKETNPDTVGWLQVNNTKVNYPVVQAPNNSYYLRHDFNRNSNSLGWIFMDFRNNVSELDKNTIIYGHNLLSGLMFGSLKVTLNQSWYTNKNNQYITFNTEDGDKKWKIFSIYKIAKTNDYLYVKFFSDQEFLNFANKMKDRSIYDFGVDIDKDDKILTLSTCQTSGKERLVVHAILVD